MYICKLKTLKFSTHDMTHNHLSHTPAEWSMKYFIQGGSTGILLLIPPLESDTKFLFYIKLQS